MSLLEVEDLDVHYDSDEGVVRAVDGVSLDVDEGERVGIVGESGCGKSTLAKAIIGVLPRNGSVEGGEIRYRGEDLTRATEKRRREVKWDEISLIAQSAMNALDPVYTVGDQIAEAVRMHYPETDDEAVEDTIDRMFELVGLDRARADDYPHQFSGGMRQRAMIAMALSLDPALVLADEPTTALDVVTQDQILKRVTEIQDELDSSMVVVTHDVAVVAETCDRVVVMYAGRVVEEGPVEDIFANPYHPYTLGLTNAFLNVQTDGQELVSIDGHPPDLTDSLSGCRFAERCPISTDECFAEDPSFVERGDLRSRCHHVDRIDEELRPRAGDAETWQSNDSARRRADDD